MLLARPSLAHQPCINGQASCMLVVHDFAARWRRAVSRMCHEWVMQSVYSCRWYDFSSLMTVIHHSFCCSQISSVGRMRPARLLVLLGLLVTVQLVLCQDDAEKHSAVVPDQGEEVRSSKAFHSLPCFIFSTKWHAQCTIDNYSCHSHQCHSPEHSKSAFYKNSSLLHQIEMYLLKAEQSGNIPLWYLGRENKMK